MIYLCLAHMSEDGVEEKSGIKGTFLFGARKGNPWEGYGDVDNQVEDGE